MGLSGPRVRVRVSFLFLFSISFQNTFLNNSKIHNN
jgi:hypothetical protein